MRAANCFVAALCLTAAAQSAPWKGVLVNRAQVTPTALRDWKRQQIQAVVLNLDDSVRAAAYRIESAGLDLYYWIEIGRNPELADTHPDWMASLQGHPEWRRFFPSLPKPAANETVKNYPWVPVLYKEAFDAHLARVAKLLKDQPPPKGIFLNDLQAAPSACGCGNHLCRWTSDYGPIHTATRLPASAAANFVKGMAKLSPEAEIIPVWTTECEEQDKEQRCAGVGCFAGTCWREYTAQLMPVARQNQTLAALLPFRAVDRDPDWVARALRSFIEMPPKRNGDRVDVNRIIAVLQGWDVSPTEVRVQVRGSQEAGAAGHLLSLMKIEQGWEPRIVQVRR
jgi:hypothetical protein